MTNQNTTLRYYAYTAYIRKIFGERVQKVSVDAGFTCPNRDGKKGRGGCTYCNNDSFNPSYCKPEIPVSTQLEEGIRFHKVRYRRANKYLAYFQPFSNTYATVEKLREIYLQAMNTPGVAGLVISTRPDCLPDETISLLGELAQNRYVQVEIGVESCHNSTLERINRQHTFEEAVDAFDRLKSAGLATGAHLIFGLPGESEQDMLESVRQINRLKPDTVKFHQLQIVKGTLMAKDYNQNPGHYPLFFQPADYIRFLMKVIPLLHPEIAIERFAGEVPPRFRIAPDWGNLRIDRFNKMIETALENNNIYQGTDINPS
ncbi:MAG: TIGR01212 family radical SAM protein [Bacteroidales bacterium]